MNECILIVEDDLNLLHALSEFFADDFKEVLTAPDGISAYLIIKERSKKPDLIFSDIRMPGWDGLQFVASLRAEGDNTPVLFSSGTAEKDDLIKALKLGAVDFVQKPYDFKYIKMALYRVMEISRRESEMAALVEKFGDLSDVVVRQSRLIGLFRVSNSRKM